MASSLEEAMRVCEGENIPFVIGGADVYAATLPKATRLYITNVEAEAPADVDVWFPEFRNDWVLEESSEWMEAGAGIKYRFESWLRRD